ncbi:MAG: TIGR04133 family radical SAM/SPASM protein [Spirochaetales bacterium]|nr:TIGR04133 family radical SAM/SPASM protein [Spirochaetales bacterium]
MKNIPLKKRISLNLFKHYRKVLTSLHELTYLFWECTLRCNLACIHCGSDCLHNPGIKDMPLSDFLSVLDSLKDRINPHLTTIALTGGEPLMRNDLEECGRAISARGFPWGMVTNGYVFTAKRFEQLLRSGLKSLTISLDGLEQSHNWLRGRGDSYKKALHAIEIAAKEKGIIFDVVTCVNQKNINELEMVRELLVNRGVSHWRIFTIFPRGRAKDNPLLDVSPGQFRDVMEFIRQTREKKIIHASYGCEGFLGMYEAEVRDSYFFCRAGIDIGSVLVDGSISACPSLRGDYIQGTIYKDDFYDVWEHRFQVMRNRKWTKTGSCTDCSVYKWCLGNGLHLREEKTGNLLRCHYRMLMSP